MTLSPRILIADDHPMLLRGLNDSLLSNGYNVIAAVKDGALALQSIVELQPDIALLDIEMPMLNGFEVIEKCKANGVKTSFIVLTSHKEKGFVAQAQKLQIKGYLLKDEPFYDLERCIEMVHKGEQCFSKVFQDVLDEQVIPEIQKIKRLTSSERIIINYISVQLSSQQIADELNISIRTVQKHRTNIISKLEINTSEGALKKWVQENAHFL